MRLKQFFLLLGLAAALLLTASCSRMELNIDELMQAPMLTEEQNAINTALQDAVGDRIQLKYPKAGDYRSAFVMHDLDGDGADEAIAFYSLADQADTNIRINILTKTSLGWISTYDEKGEGTNVDRVDFRYVTQPDRENIVVGWSNVGSGQKKSVMVYTYEDLKLTPESSSALDYTEMLLHDLNGDGLDELVLLNSQPTSNRTSIRLYEVQDGEFQRAGDINSSNSGLDGGISGFPRVQVGWMDEDTEAIFVDYTVGRGLGTIVLRYDASAPKNYRLVDVLGRVEAEDNEVPQTDRRQKIYCEDVNGDGIIEVPAYVKFPGYGDQSEVEALAATQYFQITGNRTEVVWYGLVNVSAGYRFQFPESWEDVVTVKKQQENGDMYFFVYDGESLDGDQQGLLYLRAFGPNQVVDRNDTRKFWNILSDNGVYQAYLPSGVKLEDEDLRISEDEVRELFREL